MKRLVKVLVATIVALALLNGLALAAWSSAGAGDGAATAADMPPGNAPRVSSSAGSVTIDWDESFIGSPLQGISTMTGGSYRVYRHTAAEGGDTSPFCEVPTLTCGGTLDAGTHYFSVQPLLGNWTGQESRRVARTIVTDGADIAITFPAHGATYSPASFLSGCATTEESDACGSAAAAPETELTAVEASLHSTSEGKYLDWATGMFTSTDALYAPLSTGAWELAIPALADGGYTFTVEATDNNGVGGGALSTFTIDSTPPAQVPDVTLSTPHHGATFNTTQISYSGMAGVLQGDSATVTVELFEGTGTDGTVLETREASRETNGSWTVASELTLTAGTYTARAQQENTPAGTGYSSANTFTITPPAVPPTLPSDVSASNPTASSLRLSWTDTSTTETKFVYQYSANNGPWLPTVGVDVASTSHATIGEQYESTVSDLSCGASYRFQVKAVDATANIESAYTAPSTAVATSSCPAPALPTGVAAITPTTTSLRLQWTDSSTTETKFVYQYSANNGAWQPVDGVDIASTTQATTGQLYQSTVTGLNCATNYRFQVKAVDATANIGSAYTAPSATIATSNCVSIGVTSFASETSDNGQQGNNLRWETTITMTVRDASNAVVDGAVITGAWGYAFGQGTSQRGVGAEPTLTCTTGADGTCSVRQSQMQNNVLGATFTVDGIAKAGHVWQATPTQSHTVNQP